MTFEERYTLEQAIHRVTVAYARLCDERTWDTIVDVFSEDASATYGGWPVPNRDAILAMLKKHLGGCGPTQHLLGNLVVDVDGDTVRSRVSIRAAHLGTNELAQERYEAMGEYRDTWTQTPQGWRIKHREMVMWLEYGSRKVLRPAP